MTVGRGRPCLRRPRTLAGKAFVAFVVVVILLALAWIATSIVMERRLAAALRRAEVEFGLPNRIEDLLPTSVPPEQNAAVPLDDAAAIVELLFRSAAGWTSRDGVAARLQADPSLGRRLMTPEVDQLLEEADRRPNFAPIHPLRRPWVLQPTSAPHRERRLLLESESIVGRQLAIDGRPDEAVQRLLRILRISRKWTAGEPYFGDFVSNLSRRASLIEELNRIVRSARLEPRLHDAIDHEMNEQDGCHALFLRFYQIEKIKRLEDFDASPARRPAWWLVGPLADNDRLLIVNWYDRILCSLPRPYAEVAAELEAADAELRAISTHWLGRRLHPDALGVTAKSYRADYLQTRARCMRVVNAMARQDRWDADVDTLGLPPEYLVDPIDNGRLRLKRTAAGPIVYSIGRDLADNDGALDAQTLVGMDVGLGPPKK